jgi:hypothetical protein
LIGNRPPGHDFRTATEQEFHEKAFGRCQFDDSTGTFDPSGRRVVSKITALDLRRVAKRGASLEGVKSCHELGELEGFH